MNQINQAETMESCSNLQADRDLLVNENIGLAYSFAKNCQNRGLPLEDLRQEALLGLLEAAEHFEPERGLKFGTYAGYWIKKRLLAALEQENKAVRNTEPLGERDLADHKQQVDARIESSITFPSAMPDLERGVLQLSLNEGLALKEVASRLGISVERVKQLRGKALRRLRS